MSFGSPRFAALLLVIVASVLTAACAGSEVDDGAGGMGGANPLSDQSGGAVQAGGSGASTGGREAATNFACPAPGAAFEVLFPLSETMDAQIIPMHPERGCASDLDCPAPDRCFTVAPRRGVCSAPTGVRCSDYQSHAKGPQAVSGGGGAGNLSCDSEQGCYYVRCAGFLNIADWQAGCDQQACLSNGCASDADCAGNETCVPGWVGPSTANECMPADCKSDADCADSPCGKCVFLKTLQWPFNSNPTVTYRGATCL